MEQYIKKSALVAEIEKYISNYKGILNRVDKSSDDWVESTLMLESKIDILQHILSFMDTLEVKEVDLENSVKGRIDYPFIGVDFPNIYPNYKELKDYCDKNGIKDEDEVKIIIIKDGIL